MIILYYYTFKVKAQALKDFLEFLFSQFIQILKLLSWSVHLAFIYTTVFAKS